MPKVDNKLISMGLVAGSRIGLANGCVADANGNGCVLMVITLHGDW